MARPKKSSPSSRVPSASPVESRKASKARLQREGRWRDFQRTRQELEDEGIGAYKSHVMALVQFPPRSADQLRADGITGIVHADSEEGQVSLESPGGIIPPTFLPGNPPSVAPSPRNSPLSPGGTGAEPPRYKPGDFGPVGSLTEQIKWIHEHMGCDMSALSPDACPGAGAWDWLAQCQVNPAVKADFRTKVLIRILPSKAEQDRAARRQDDGRKTFDVINRIRKFHGIGKK